MEQRLSPSLDPAVGRNLDNGETALPPSQRKSQEKQQRTQADGFDTSGRPRKRVRLACDACRSRKSRCDGSKPPCSSCRDHNTECVYLPWKTRATVTEEYVEKLRHRNRVLQQTLHSVLKDGSKSKTTPPPLSSPPNNSHETINRGRVGASCNSSPQDKAHPGENTAYQDIVGRQRATSITGNGKSPEQGHTPDDAETGVPKYEPPRGWVEDEGNKQDDQTTMDVDSPPKKSWESVEGYFGESSMFAFISNTGPQKNAVDKESKSSPVQSAGRNQGSQSSLSVQQMKRYEREKADLDDCLALPQRYIADQLVNAYFTYIAPLLPFIHEPTFRAKYERTWLGSEGDDMTCQSLSWIGQLNLVFAFGCEYDQSNMTREQARRLGSRFFNRSKTILFSEVFHSANLETIQTILLMCHYMQSTTSLNKCWSLVGLCIRMAHGMGLHLEPSRWNIGRVECEIRRRLWWGCYVVDRVLSLRYGRPPNKLDETANVRFPIPIDDEYLADDKDDLQQPEGKPARCHILLAEISFAGLIESVLREVYLNVKATKIGDDDAEGAHVIAASKSYPKPNLGSDDILCEQARLIATVARLDGELIGWQRTLPPHLRVDTPLSDSSIDWSSQRQRNVLNGKHLALRIVLHRKIFLLFRHKRIEDDFQRSMVIACVKQCVKLSRELIHMFLNFHQQKMVNMLWYDAQYLFIAVGVLVSLESLDDYQRDLLGDLVQNEDDETLRRGFNLLKEMGAHNAMARRLVEPLEKILRENHIAGKIREDGNSRPSGPIPGFAPMSDRADVSVFANGIPPSAEESGNWAESSQQPIDNIPSWEFGFSETFNGSDSGMFSDYPPPSMPMSDMSMLWDPLSFVTGPENGISSRLY